MSDPRPGPRIGMVHDCHYYQHFFDRGAYPALGLRRDEYSNSGVFLIKPGVTQNVINEWAPIKGFLDKEEFLYLLNLKHSGFMKPNPWETGGEQEFLNEVFSQKFSRDLRNHTWKSNSNYSLGTCQRS